MISKIKGITQKSKILQIVIKIFCKNIGKNSRQRPPRKTNRVVAESCFGTEAITIAEHMSEAIIIADLIMDVQNKSQGIYHLG